MKKSKPDILKTGAFARHATWLELFYDLIYVVVIARLAHLITHAHDNHLSLEAYLLFVALFICVWWAWTGHTMFQNRFDNDDTRLPVDDNCIGPNRAPLQQRSQRQIILREMNARQAIGVAHITPVRLGVGHAPNERISVGHKFPRDIQARRHLSAHHRLAVAGKTVGAGLHV